MDIQTTTHPFQPTSIDEEGGGPGDEVVVSSALVRPYATQAGEEPHMPNCMNNGKT